MQAISTPRKPKSMPTESERELGIHSDDMIIGHSAGPGTPRLVQVGLRGTSLAVFSEAEMITSATKKLVSKAEMIISALETSISVPEVIVSRTDIMASCI